MESVKELVEARKKLVEEQTKLSNNIISALLEKLENEYDYSVTDNNPEKFELKKEGNVCYLRDKEKGYIIFNNCIKTKKKGLVFNGKIIDFLEKDWAISVDIEKKKLLNVILLNYKESSEKVDTAKLMKKEKNRKISKIEKKQEQAIISLYNKGKSLAEISKEVPFSTYQLSFITRELVEQKKVQNREYYLGTYIFYSDDKEKFEKRNNIKKERDLSDKNNKKLKKITKEDKVTKKTEELKLKNNNFKTENQEVKEPKQEIKQEILELVEECLNKKISLYNKQLEYYNNVEVKKEHSQVVESIHFLLKSPFFNALFISLYLTIIFILVTNYPAYTSIISIEVSEFWFITLVAIMASETIKYLLLKLK